jgi:hypothetical protein
MFSRIPTYTRNHTKKSETKKPRKNLSTPKEESMQKLRQTQQKKEASKRVSKKESYLTLQSATT